MTVNSFHDLDMETTHLTSENGPKLPAPASSTTILHEDPSDHDMNRRVEGVCAEHFNHSIHARIRVETDVQRRQKPKNNPANPPKRQLELEYQKVLRSLITEFKEVIAQTNATTVPIPKTTKPDALNATSWKRVLFSVGMKKFAHQNDAALPIFNIKDDRIAKVLENLIAEFGRGTHSSFLDDTYSIYLRDDDRAAVCFKVIKKIAVMYGDPLCAAIEVQHVFEQFRSFCKRQHCHLVVVGAGQALGTYAKTQRWRTVEFAVEQVLNPVTNSVLAETSGKTIRRTNRKLVAGGVKLHLYEPRRGIQPQLEQELMEVYHAWREDRRRRNAPQAYSATINPFVMPNITRYLYTKGTDGKPNSLAGLIQMGAKTGCLLEPCIQMPDAPKGITGFLVTHAMGLLREQGVTCMTFGLEALPEIGEITLMPSLIEDISRRIYRATFDALGLRGIKEFHATFHPEKGQEVPLYILFPPGVPRVSMYQAVLGATHISPQEVWNRSQAARSARRKQERTVGAKKPVKAHKSAQQEPNGPDKST